MQLLLRLVAAACTASSSAAAAPLDAASLHAELLRAIKPVLAAGSAKSNDTGFSFGLYSSSWNVSLATGLNDRVTKEKLRPTDMMMWGSVTKQYTAASVLRQVERGKLTLDEPIYTIIDPWLRKVNGTTLRKLWGKEVEVVSARQVIQMASGFQDFEVEPHLRLLQNAYPDSDLDNPINAVAWTNKTFFFPPGYAAVYSSFNFEIAGLLLAALDGASSWQTYDQRAGAMDAPLSKILRHTGFPNAGPCKNFRGGTHDGKNGSTAHGYQYLRWDAVRNLDATDQALFKLAGGGRGFKNYSDVVDMSCVSGWACGNLAASSPDVAAFLYHYYGKHPQHGAVLKDKGLREQITTTWRAMCIQNNPTYPCTPDLNYGLGVMEGGFGGLNCDHRNAGGCSSCSYNATVDASNRTVPIDCYQYGHGGEEYGFTGNSLYWPEHDISMALNANLETSMNDIWGDGLWTELQITVLTVIAKMQLAKDEAGAQRQLALDAAPAPPTCNVLKDTDFWCFWPKNNPNHTGTACDEIAQIPSKSPEQCCQQCIANSSSSSSAHAGTLNCSGYAYNFKVKLCFMKALATAPVVGHVVKSTDSSGRLVFS